MRPDLKKLLKIDHTVVQAPMFGVTTPQMVAVASNAGFLGSAALGDLDPESSVRLLRECRKLTNRPFAANIFVNAIPEITPELRQRYEQMRGALHQLAEKLGLEVEFPDIDSARPKGYRAQIDALLEEGIEMLSFTFGNLDRESVEKLKEKGVVLVGTCTSGAEARELMASGIDLLCVQGLEAGGHRGSFSDDNIPQIGGLSLLQNVREMTELPLIYAGGVTSKKAVKSARLLGADGVQIGSLLLCSQESALTPSEKQALIHSDESANGLIRSFSGRFARGVQNEFVALFETSEQMLPYPYQNKLTGAFRKAARAANLTQYVNLWAGQTACSWSFESTGSILQKLI